MSRVVFFLISITIVWSETISLGFHEEDSVATIREYGKCNYFVVKKGDLSRQYSCIMIATSVLRGHGYRRASWYYLVGGDVDRAFDVATLGLAKGDYYLAETLAHIYLIKNDNVKAKKYFKLFVDNVDENMAFILEHFEILDRLYRDRFSVKRAKALLGDNMFLLNR